MRLLLYGALCRQGAWRENDGESGDYAGAQGSARAHKTLKHVQGAWVKDHKVECNEGKITGYKVILKVTFVLED